MTADKYILDRRIACDRALPTCTQCRHSNRACKGYGVRLSWPRANDAKRAVVSRAPRRVATLESPKASTFQVNASSGDIEMHRYLLGSLSNEYTQVALKAPVSFSYVMYNDTDGQLIDYFEHTASKCLAILGHDPQELGRILLRMALSSSSPAATAVRNAILALSSLHRRRMQGQGFEFKIAAIKALGEASKICILGTEIFHVAAGMLLCSIEIHEASCTSGQWRFYITGVKKIIEASYLSQYRYGRGRDIDSDVSTLLDWVHYHDALARFSSLHWNREPHNNCFPAQLCTEIGKTPTSIYKILPVNEIVNPSSTASLVTTMLKLLEYGCEALSPRNQAMKNSAYTIETLAQLIKPLPFSPTSDPILELFYHAIFVYLNRASNGALEESSVTDRRITQSLNNFPITTSCPRQFPLFVLGCEAKSDSKRCIVLDAFERTEKSHDSRSVFLSREFVKRVWVQDDLALSEAPSGIDGVGYSEKLSAVLGGCGILPPFV
ncbi:transcription factor domain-containing protein [Aspergillus undulatus]|uniref:transcription factor domain-containing protein n=1 Tax=Aspergillus undulatus TaxID=1810928 RepID=UPI003CCCF753